MKKLNDFVLFLNGEQVEEPVKCNGLGCDLGQEGGDKTAVSTWNPNTGELTMTLTIENEDNPLGKWYHNCIRKFNLQKKALLWAVTHGYFIVLPSCDERCLDREIVIRTPKTLKMILPCMPFICEYKLYDKDGMPCVIKRGKVVKL